MPMATAPKTGRSFSSERQLIELAKTVDIEGIVKKTGWKPEAIVRMAKRLGIKIKMVDAR
jgi:hypothetical protein